MRNLKRALSLALASVMLLGMMVVGTSAASYTDVDAADNLEAIEVLKAVGVMEGDDNGNFNPDKKVTRNEMAVVMCNLLGLTPGGTTPFTDVPAWAQGYVAACYNNGIIAGISADKFGGDTNITAVQAGLMVMKALGYFGYQGEFGDDWKLAVVKQANKIDLYKGINAYTEKVMTRNEIAQMVLNALECTVMVVEQVGGMNIEGNGIVVTEKPVYKYTEADNRSNVDYRDVVPVGAAATMQLCEKLYGTDLKKFTAGADDDFGRPSTKWTYIDKTVVSPKSVVLTYTADVKEAVVDKDLKNYTYPAGATDVWNNGYKTAGQTVTDASIASLTGKGRVVEVYANDTKQITDVVVIDSYLAKVTKVTDKDETITVTLQTAGGETITTDKGYGDYKVDDYLMVSPKNSNATTIDAGATKKVLAIAAVTKIDNVEVTYRKDKKATIGGVDYEQAAVIANGTTALNSLTLASKVDIILDSYGYVVKADGTAAAAGDYIYVYSTYSASEKGETSYYALGVLKDGTIKELKIDSNSNKKIVAGKANPANADSTAGDTGTATAANLLYTYTTSGGVASLTYAVGATAYGHTASFSAGDMKPALKALNTKHYFADNVTFITVTGSNANELKANVYTGVQTVSTATAATYVTTKSINNSTNGTINLVFINGDASQASDDLIYVKSNAAVGVKRIDNTNVNTYTVYINGVKTEIPTDSSISSNAFYSYSVDDNGKYKLTSYTNKVDGDEDISNLYNGVMTSTSLTNYDISKATIYDLTDNGIESAGALENLFKTGATVKVAVVYNDTDKVIETLYIVSATATVSGSNGSTTMTLSGITASYLDSIEVDVDDGTARTATVSTLTVTLSAAVNTGDEVTLTINTTNGFEVVAVTTI